jgi:hypothetical protein
LRSSFVAKLHQRPCLNFDFFQSMTSVDGV